MLLALDGSLKSGFIKHVPGWAVGKAKAAQKQCEKLNKTATDVVQGSAALFNIPMQEVNDAATEARAADRLSRGLLTTASDNLA